ncbi:General transcription factor IIF subunit 2 [Pitangus sulphuratus]|nr:General transcription factor IIF subunit 2 [Pitangus sulphuratus]
MWVASNPEVTAASQIISVTCMLGLASIQWVIKKEIVTRDFGDDTDESGLNKLALEGIVVQRAECRPAASENYMKLKRLQIEESSKPLRLSQQLDKAVTTNYKPVANHQYNIEYEKKKKEDGKRARADKQQVLDMLFSAFEKHQYYNIKDLVDITKQPVIYLKEILREIGIYNVKGTHKNTWELKPEYRHYQGEEKSD